MGSESDWSDRRLNSISTQWSLVAEANRDGAAAEAARQAMLERYGGAIRRYLVAAVRDPEAADELFQEFALRFCEGRLAGADPGRGRFRDYVKGMLFHLIAQHRARAQRQPRAMGEDLPEPGVEDPSTVASDREFLANWRGELLDRAWEALADAERRTGQPYHAVLRLRAEQPGTPSHELAGVLAEQLGRPFTAVGIRQLLYRARVQFADALIDHVTHSLDRPDPEAVERELADLGLLDYCRPRLGQA